MECAPFFSLDTVEVITNTNVLQFKMLRAFLKTLLH